MTRGLHAPAPATLGEGGAGPGGARATAPRRAVGISLLLHLSAFAAIALLVDGTDPAEPPSLPVEIVTPDALDDAAAEARIAALPPIELPTTLPDMPPGIGGGLARMSESWPSVPVKIRPPRLTARTTTQMRAPDLPPPLPAFDGYDLESSLRKADADPVAGLVTAGTHPDNPPPIYPDQAKRLGLQGQAIVRVTVTAEGEPHAPILVESSGWAMLDDAALQSVRTWRFVPAERGGTAVRTTIELPIVYKLDEG